jgi:hypothetical protein
VSNYIIGAITRTDTSDIKGFGEIARLKFTIDSNATVGDQLGLKIVNSGGAVASGDSTNYNHPAGGESDTTLVINPPQGLSYKNSIMNYELRIIPNPYTGSTTITYRLEKPSDVKLEVFDMLGKKVATLVNESKKSGSHHVKFSAGDYNYPQGIYFLKLNVNGEVTVRRLVEY